MEERRGLAAVRKKKTSKQGAKNVRSLEKTKPSNASWCNMED